MPAYDYDCAACGRRFEVDPRRPRGRARRPVRCVARVPSARRSAPPAVHYKGSGWAKKERRATRHGSVEERRRRRARTTLDDGRASSTDGRLDGRRSGSVDRLGARHSETQTSDAEPTSRRVRRVDAPPTERDGRPDRLDHPCRGSRDPGRHQRPFHARRRSAAGRGPGACRASSWAAGGSSGAARSGRSSPRLGASTRRTSSRSCSRTSAADPADDRWTSRRSSARFLDRPQVARVRAVLDIYGRAAGGLLANGLAFSALFAAIPTMLLVLGLAGWVANDPAVRQTDRRCPHRRVPAARGADRRRARRDQLRSGRRLDPRPRSASSGRSASCTARWTSRSPGSSPTRRSATSSAGRRAASWSSGSWAPSSSGSSSPPRWRPPSIRRPTSRSRSPGRSRRSPAGCRS